MRLLCDENLVGLNEVADYCEVRTAPGRAINRSMLKDADALWVRSVTRVDEQMLAGTSVRFVGTATAGYEHLDLDYLQRAHIAFSAAPGANANAVVEYVLAVLAQLVEPWKALDAGATLAIVGAGNVGRLLGQVSTDLGWRCLLYDPWLAETADAPPVPGARWATFDEVLQSEVISLHCALHERSPWPSRHLIGALALAKLQAGQWLINASRGAVIDNAALLQRLQQGDAPGVVLDVWESEPDFDARLLGCEALHLATPHVAGYSVDAKWEATRRLLRATPGLEQVALTVPEAPALVSTQGESACALAGSLLSQAVPLRDDDKAMRALAGLSPAARGERFDLLRRDYPARRELRGRSLSAPTGEIAGEVGKIRKRVLAALGLSWA